MEKQDIVKRLLGMGIMATPDTLSRIEADGFDAFLANAKQNQCMVMQEAGGKGKTITCCVRDSGGKAELTPQDIIQANSERFKKISGLLLRKMDAVSINNVRGTGTKVSVVGMVKELASEGFILEDGTGEMAVKTKEKVELDDVIGVRGWMRDNQMFGEEIVYPDIPIDRNINSLDSKLLLLGDEGGQAGEADVVLSSTSMRDRNGDEKTIPNPGWVFMENGNSKMTVMVYRQKEKIEKEDALRWLKKRYVGGGSEHLPSPGRILEDIPDIFWLVSQNAPWAANYKGVTLISFGNGHKALIDLKTRKIELQ